MTEKLFYTDSHLQEFTAEVVSCRPCDNGYEAVLSRTAFFPAGGGGFIQVILKKDVTKEQLHERLHGVFQDSGVDVWDCELLV